VNLPTSVDVDALAAACTGRPPESLFPVNGKPLEDLSGLCAGSNVLVTGAAGFIARATLNHILAAQPRAIYFMDSSENGLADLARTLAATLSPERLRNIHFLLADITSPLFELAMREINEIDLVLHFAAAKHVRSERDAPSALRIFDINVLGTSRLLQSLQAKERLARVFAVSTDKAVLPTSLMGASKTLMESLLVDYPGEATSARFANVLFSSGSITESWIERLSRREPLSVPNETFRYLVSPAEAGRICANALVAPCGSLVIPGSSRVQPERLDQVAETFLSYFDLEPIRIPYRDWLEGTLHQAVRPGHAGTYPLITTPRDTSGEKHSEEFAYPDELPRVWTNDLKTITLQRHADSSDIVNELSKLIEGRASVVALDDLVRLITKSVPVYTATQTAETLDHRI